MERADNHMPAITFITGNMNKVAQVAKFLNIPLAHHKLDLDELQSLDLHRIVEHKAKQAYELLQKPVLVEDVSLRFTAMGRLPGPFIKWFIEEIGTTGLAKLAAGLPSQEAHCQVCYGLYDGREMHFFDGEMHGRIAPAPRGNGGFGFDAIFINDGYDMTRAEMNEGDYRKTSHRAAGLIKLQAFLEPER
jgi:non-canonical purine NTP pyrophosphatase (RdgB/HAM1 family)